MTKKELFAAMQKSGYTEPDFFSELEEDEPTTRTIQQLIRLMESGETVKAWDEIERLHDEFIYFGSFDDDLIVYTTNEAWMP